jgi:hypothetical protein
VALRRKKDEPTPSETAVPGPPDPEDAAAAAAAPSGGESPLSAHWDADHGVGHPEVLVGAAFAGGFALALFVKRLAR